MNFLVKQAFSSGKKYKYHGKNEAVFLVVFRAREKKASNKNSSVKWNTQADFERKKNNGKKIYS